MQTKLAAALVTAGIAGVVVGAAINSGGSSPSKTVTIAGGVTTIRTGPVRTVTRYVVHVHTHTVTQTATTTAPASAATPAEESSGEDPGPYEGGGSKSLGTITVATPSTLRWTCSTCNVFGVDGLSPEGHAIAISSDNTTSGETAVEPGTYHEVNIIANETEGGTGWTITFTAGQ